MSDPGSQLSGLPHTNEPLRIAVRRMRWFRSAFRRHVETVGGQIGCRFEIDEARLAACFVRWLRAVEAQKPADRAARRAYFEFSAGLMLRELTADMPLRAAGVPTLAGEDTAAAFWPEGYACTMFCLAVNAAAIAQEFDATATTAPAMDDLRQWWSFRENAERDPDFSIAFLEMLLGRQPNWSMPESFAARMQAELAGKAVDPLLGAAGGVPVPG